MVGLYARTAAPAAAAAAAARSPYLPVGCSMFDIAKLIYRYVLKFKELVYI